MGEIPDIIIGRLPRYLHTLEHLMRQGIQTTSSQELGRLLGLSSAQIRKDLSQFGEFGKQGTGYAISFLVQQLRAILNVNQTWQIALVGAGDLGHAIARYQGFENRGFFIAAVFDKDPQKIGQSIGTLVVEDSRKIPERVRELGIKVAMLTVPAADAQAVVDLLVESGVQAILNYAPVVLKVPGGVHVKDIDPINSLQHMTYYIG